MSYISDIWLYLYEIWLSSTGLGRTVNEMSNFLHTGQIGDFIFCPVVYASQLSVHLMCLQGSWLNM